MSDSQKGEAAPRAQHRLDYEPYPFAVPETRLKFDIHPGQTTVTSELAIERLSEGHLVLNGADLELLSLRIDGRELGGNEYRIDGETLALFDVPERCTLSVVTRIHPETNTALEGLYRSRSMYCTQCEAEGFRKITWFPDRPDVLSRYTTTIEADAETCPVLLAGGNLLEEREEGGRRSVTWQDPFPKPSYLFALVAGDLALSEDEFVTMSGRQVALRIYSEPHNIDQCGYAMGALKRAMRWDEERFGREYDLDNFMIVAVEDFNMGAMENKGLNIFNTSCVLASPDTATDAAYQRVEAVVAHEYFHNWSGNRVTCRDWFQLSLKEGFTVFRDQEFSSDMNSRSVKRVEDVKFLRDVQFAEDAGPLAHAVRPDSYVEISNFYTTTVYEKGAEVVRMLATLLGRSRFRAACDLYFERHDGEAVTIEDFVAAMEKISGHDLSQFRRWYAQAGTPVLNVEESRSGERIELAIEQACPPTPEQATKEPFHIPLALGLVANGSDRLGAAGKGASIRADADVEEEARGAVVHMRGKRLALAFENAGVDAQVSFLRGFSAPVKVRYPRSREVLAELAATDSDGFARWDAAQDLLVACILASAGEDALAGVAVVTGLFERLWLQAMDAPDDGEAKALLAATMTLPQVGYLLETSPGRDILALADVRDGFLDAIADHLDWEALAAAQDNGGAYSPDPVSIARRQLKAAALGFAVRRLDRTDPARAQELLGSLLDGADNLTDRLLGFHGLLGLVSMPEAAKQVRIDEFHDAWASEALVLDAWFSAQAGSSEWGTLPRIRALAEHPSFDIANPNKVRALHLRFAIGNVRGFHATGGASYRWLAETVVEMDPSNPQVAARMARALAPWRRHSPARGRLMREALSSIRRPGLSKDVIEVIEKALSG